MFLQPNDILNRQGHWAHETATNTTEAVPSRVVQKSTTRDTETISGDLSDHLGCAPAGCRRLRFVQFSASGRRYLHANSAAMRVHNVQGLPIGTAC